MNTRIFELMGDVAKLIEKYGAEFPIFSKGMLAGLACSTEKPEIQAQFGSLIDAFARERLCVIEAEISAAVAG